MGKIIVLLFIILCSKYIIFIVSLLLLKLFLINKDKRIITSNDISNLNHKKTILSRIYTNIRLLANSYIRFSIIKTGYIPSFSIRNWIYRNIYSVKLNKHVIIHYGAEIRNPSNLIIGKGTIIGDNAILDARNGIIIGENVNFSSRVSIWTEQHNHRDPYFKNTQPKKPVIIKDRVWVGPNSIILHSVEIGEGAVIAAGSVVTKDIPPFSIVAGIPATIIGQREKKLLYDFTKQNIPYFY